MLSTISGLVVGSGLDAYKNIALVPFGDVVKSNKAIFKIDSQSEQNTTWQSQKGQIITIHIRSDIMGYYITVHVFIMNVVDAG